MTMNALQNISASTICWHVTVTMPASEVVDLPHSLKHSEECPLDQCPVFHQQTKRCQWWGLRNILKIHIKKVRQLSF